MKAKANRIQKLSENFAVLLEREQQDCQTQINTLIEAVKLIQGDTADRRLQQLTSQLKALQQRLRLLLEMGRGDFLAKIEREAEAIAQLAVDGRAVKIIDHLLGENLLSLNLFCERLLDSLIEITQAERGFILFYLPESTQADVVAARNFQTRNLALEEYNFSRTLLQEVFRRGATVFVEDALSDPLYGKESSVINHQLKSILVTPLKHGARTIGALYLENHLRSCAFDEDAPQVLEVVARFAVFYLLHARLLPTAFETDHQVFLDESKAAKEIIGRNAKILAVQEIISRIADSTATVLIEGESGTGKELVARALHYQSLRRQQPFVAINCAAIPEALLESELFGHEKGAFTGALERYVGRLERGDGGTIFLDEISELAYPLQAKLLRFLQSNEFDRLGGKQSIRVNARIVAATSKDLQTMTEVGKFQEALFYRLRVIPITLPPLRERLDDIPLLMAHFLEKYSLIYNRQICAEAEVAEFLQAYEFRGNVRELENLIHRLVVLATDEVIRIGDLPVEILQVVTERISLKKTPLYQLLETPPLDLEELRRRRGALRKVLLEQQRALIERVIAECNGNLTQAAQRLGVNRVTLHKLLKPTKIAKPEDLT
jgi:Nif-specific regulatory protein